MSTVEAYNDRLRERRRTKSVVRELGLLNRSKALGAAARGDQLARSGGPAYARLRRFARLMCAYDYDFLAEGLRHELELRREVLHLQARMELL